MKRTQVKLPKTTVIVIHLIIWICIFGIVPVIRFVSGDPIDLNYFLHPFFIVFHLYIIGLFYLNALVLVPFCLHKWGVGWYVLATILCVLASGLLVFLVFPPHHAHQHHRGPDFLFSSVFPGFFVCAVSTTYRILGDRLRAEQKINELENEQLKTELSFLRSQVSPHFMFNVLNNIVSLSRKNSDQVESTVIKLSSLMRYMLYESDAEKVSLDREVEYLKSYIDLQKMRFGSDLQVSFEVNNASTRNFIEPMLLIPFVENAFKHGVVSAGGPGITIQLKTWEEELLFVVNNKFNPDSVEEKDNSSGIGLNNVRRRLNLLYGENHSLEISQKADTFTVILKLKLK
jgi:two-component system LytT family sensor kinase